ncbi:transporter substrate-binding domain-containing protein [Lentisphaera marina]|uniref:transporter substrate-binding domain-containing protein n=1 Tax=Lentisphaera marina TaxID=1111041 RepID=UPI0023659738|nr:transporter substrate-binding domain-containing protein [Lentisphaera marina]MDD7983769.1 transporter substrate-binding domain-containing protein [Lentisphaera marina]
MRKHFLISFILLFISISLIAFIQASSSEDIHEEHFSLNVQTQLVKDLNKWDDIKNLEQLRVLVSPNRSNFFIAKDQARGFEYEMFEQLEKDLQKSLNKKNFQVIYVPVAHNKLMSSLMQGYGDVAAAMLTITPERQKIVDFSTPYLTGVSEVLIRHKSAPPH